MNIKTGDYLIHYRDIYGVRIIDITDTATSLGAAQHIAERRLKYGEAEPGMPHSFVIDRRIVDSLEPPL